MYFTAKARHTAEREGGSDSPLLSPPQPAFYGQLDRETFSLGGKTVKWFANGFLVLYHLKVFFGDLQETSNDAQSRKLLKTWLKIFMNWNCVHLDMLPGYNHLSSSGGRVWMIDSRFFDK